MALYEPALRYFLAVYETGSVNAAARRLFVAGSAVSRQLARLEKEVGAPLFERSSTGVAPTEAGHVFAVYARRAVQAAGHIVEEIHERRSADTLISLAASHGIGYSFLPRIAAEFRGLRPWVRFELHITGPEAATRMVRDGAADIAVTFTMAPQRGVRILHSTPAPLRAVVRPGHELAGRERVTLAEVSGYPLVLNPRRNTSRDLVELVRASAGKPVEPALVSENPGAMLRFVQAGDSVGLLGMITVAGDVAAGQVVAVPLVEEELRQRTVQVQVQAGRELPVAVAEFGETVVGALSAIDV